LNFIKQNRLAHEAAEISPELNHQATLSEFLFSISTAEFFLYFFTFPLDFTAARDE
jgi:hypothetical protein